MRRILSLNGIWKYIKDPSGKLKYQDILGLCLKMPESKNNITLPSNWQLAGIEDYCGVVWFFKVFTVPSEFLKSGTEHWLRFNGVDYIAEVWVNRRYLGSHEGYFDPFEYRVTGLLKPGAKNFLLVRVNSPLEDVEVAWPDRKKLIKGIFSHHDARPGSNNPKNGQSKNTGGIWNSIQIYTSGKIKIELIKVSPKLLIDGSAVVTVGVEVQNLLDKEQFVVIELQISPANFKSLQILQITRNVYLSKGGNRPNFVFSVAKPRLWWTHDHGEQNLYFLDVKVKDGKARMIDSQRVRFGIREIKVDGNKVCYLNHKRIFLRGSNIIPTQWLSEYEKVAIERDIALIKKANLNAIRVHGHINREEFYALCDEAGIMVWQDFALQWSYEESVQFIEKAADQIRRMVRILYNHPCIFAWCCHNEPTVNRSTLDPILYRAVCEEDQTRYVSEASDIAEHSYYGWYEEDYIQFKALPAAPLITEFGAQALPNLETMEEMFESGGLWPPDWGKWAYHDFQYDQTFNVAGIEKGKSIEEFINNSQVYQYNLIKFVIETYRRARFNNISGYFQFMFVDCWPAITWSVLDYYRRPKMGFKALRLASQPLLVSIEILRRKLVPGLIIFKKIYVINDLYQDFPNAILNICWEDSDGKQIKSDCVRFNIPADSSNIAYQAESSGKKWLVPEDCMPGEYYIKVKLYSKQNKLLSYNEELVLVKKLPSNSDNSAD